MVGRDREQRKREWFRQKGITTETDALEDAAGVEDADPEVLGIESLAEDYTIEQLENADYVTAEIRRLRSTAEKMDDRTPRYAAECRETAEALEFASQIARLSTVDSIEELAARADLPGDDR